MKKNILSILLTCRIVSGFAQSDSIPVFIKDSLDNYVSRSISGWQIPGAAICIVKNGKLVWMKGYGVKEAGGNDKVDENTLFMIGSNTKAFTATALAMLQHSKKLTLDDKVKKWLPGFAMDDAWVTKEANIRDLLSHRLGFETFQGDFMFFDSDLTMDQVKEKFGRIKPKYSFRSKWGYCNAAFMIAGEIIPKVSGKSWAEFLKENIFLPLGMNNTLALSRDFPAASNKSSAHTVAGRELKKIAYGKIDNLAPAGSMSSSVNDLSKWVMMQLDNGKLNGRVIMDASIMSETRLPHSILGNGGHLFNKAHFDLYGLGWFLQEYSGRKIVAHTGGVNGFVTSITLIPEEKLGIIVLTNTDANNFYEAVKWEIIDAYLGLPYRNYSQVYLGFYEGQQKADQEWLKEKKDSVAHASEVVRLAAYAGEYLHEVYGKMNITVDKGKLSARFEHHRGRIAHLEFLRTGRFLAQFNEPLFGVKVWPFALENGKVRSVTVYVADFVEFTPYIFKKIK